MIFAANEWAGEYDDDDKTDVYTNAWTPYPSIDNPANGCHPFVLPVILLPLRRGSVRLRERR